jgi:hypothetical protein
MSDVPNNEFPIQLEASTARAPVSESLIQSIGGAINRLFSLGPAVGSYEMSSLSEGVFTGIKGGSTWVLANGQPCIGSKYEALTGLSVVPDLRGLYPRMQDNGRGITPGAPSLNAMMLDDVNPHTHLHDQTANDYSGFFDINPPPPGGLLSISPYISDSTDLGGGSHKYRFKPTGVSVLPNTGSETRPKTGIVNLFIRIN